MLEISGLNAGYGNIGVLSDIGIRIAAGEIVALIGANGAGKTTLSRAISGLLPVRQGEIAFRGRPIQRLSPRERVRLGISQVPEGRQIIAGLTVGENLRLGAYVRRRDFAKRESPGRSAKSAAIFPSWRTGSAR